MAELPPNWMTGCYSPQVDRLLIQSLSAGRRGVYDVASGSLLVTTGGSGLNVSVAEGALLFNTPDNDRGSYTGYNDGPVTLTVGANASGQPRIDQVIGRLYDSAYGEGADEWVLEILPGTPQAGAQISDRYTPATFLDGAAALPDNSVTLAYILVPNGFAGPFVNATHILDARVSAGDGLWVPYEPAWFGYQNGVPAVQEARYNRVGDMVTVEYYSEFDVAGSGITVAMDLPLFLPARDPINSVMYGGNSAYVAASGANTHILYIASLNAPDFVTFVTDGANGAETGPATIGDYQSGIFTYETTAS